MRKNYLLLAGLLCLGFGAKGQILNQSAGWPNPNWTLTGTYSSAAGALEASPLTTPNFAFDDDDAGNGNDDSIIATSPAIDLTAAFNGGETSLQITVEYGYYYLESDVLRFEYWNAATSAWVPWGGNIPGNSTSVYDNFCTIPKTVYMTPVLDISGFTGAQLTGFQYRIFYDDNPAGADWNYGFCFNSPTIKSLSCAAPDSFLLTGLTPTAAMIEWSGSSDSYEYVLDMSEDDPAGDGTELTGNSFSTEDPLAPWTTYYFHIRTVCGETEFSDWATYSFTTLPVAPDNDECDGAVEIEVNDDLECGQVTSGTLAGSTDSGIEAETGLADDDVWFSFTASATTHYISISNVEGDPSDLVHELFSGECGSLTSLGDSDGNDSSVEGLTVGQTYYLRVFSYGDDTPATTTFDVCIGTMPAPQANDECAAAAALTVDVPFCDGTNTNGTNVGATDSGVENPECFNYGQNDVWFSFVVPENTATVDISTDFAGGSLNDSEIVLYSGSCGDFTEIACDQDGGEDVGNGWLSIITDAAVTEGETYYVRVAGYSESAMGSFCIEVTTNTFLGVNDHQLAGLKAYPNPVKDVLTIDFASEISNVEVFNMLGQKITAVSISSDNKSVDMSQLSKGAYIVKATSDNATKAIKVIKE